MKFKGLLLLIVMLMVTALIGAALPKVRNLLPQKATGTATLSLPASVSATSGTQFLVPITLSTTGSVRGVDVVLSFDTTKLTLTGIDATAKTSGNASFKTFVPGVSGATTGDLDATAVMNAANSSGKMEIGAVTFDYSSSSAVNNVSPWGVTPAFTNGTIVLATAKFTPKTVTSTTTTNITLDYTSGSTTDSNVVDDDPISQAAPYLNDILSSVSPAGGTAVTISPAAGGDTTPPTTSVTAPASGALVSGTTTISANASDNVGVAKVEFYVDGALKGSDTSSPYSFAWDTTNGGTHPCNGAHTHSLTTKAYDAANNTGTSTAVVVNMNNPSYCQTATTNLTVKSKFAGIISDRGALSAKVTVQDKVASGVTHNFKQTFTAANFTFVSGAYQTTVSNLSLVAGTNYEILVKGPSHLQTRVTPSGFALTSAQVGTTVTLDTTNVTVRAGDVINASTNPPSDGQDGKLTLEDLTAITYYYTDLSVPVGTTIPARRDINKDGFITIEDVTLISNNFTAFTINDDQ